MLVDACLRGDRSAFGDLVDRYQRPIFNAAYGITRSVEDAMDVTQIVFVRAYEKLHTFDPSHRFFSWIYRIAVNQSINLVRSRRPGSALDDSLPAPAPDPEAACGISQKRDRLHRALAELEPEHRNLVVLKHLQGLSYREISELLGIEETRVKSRLFTARRKLRTILCDQGQTQ